MWILPLVGYLGAVFGFCFLTLAIASGLYYLSESVEEHTVLARKILTRLIYGVISIQVLLVSIDGFPFFITALSVASHVVYMANLRHFPIVKLTDPLFILSCVLVFINHILWFRYFSHPPSQPPAYYERYNVPDIPTFTEIASFFGICVWLVPFALFVSLSASENVLPSMGSEYATGGEVPTGNGLGGPNGISLKGKSRKKGLVRAAVDTTLEWVSETGGLLRREKSQF